MLNEVFTEHSDVELLAMARSVGRKVAKKWPGLDHEDLAQEALTQLYSKADKLAGKETRYLFKVMERAAMSYASKERYDKIITSSQYVYTPAEVKALLETQYYHADSWDVPTSKDDPTKDWVEGGTIMVSLIDIKVAMEKITPADRAGLEERFYHQKGAVGDNAERQRVYRAIEHLTKFMNYGRSQAEAEYKGMRAVMSNIKAQALTEKQTGFEDSEWFEEDALDKIQKEYNDMGLRPGEGYDFDKYKE